MKGRAGKTGVTKGLATVNSADTAAAPSEPCHNVTPEQLHTLSDAHREEQHHLGTAQAGTKQPCQEPWLAEGEANPKCLEGDKRGDLLPFVLLSWQSSTDTQSHASICMFNCSVDPFAAQGSAPALHHAHTQGCESAPLPQHHAHIQLCPPPAQPQPADTGMLCH